MRLYELLSQYRIIGERTMTVEDIRHRFQLEDKYPLVGDLRRRVIAPAVKAVDEKTSVNVLYEAIKEGRSIVAFRFWFAIKEEYKRKVRFSDLSKAKQEMILEKESLRGESRSTAYKRISQQFNDGEIQY